MQAARSTLRRSSIPLRRCPRRAISSATAVETDDCAIPVRPTWSVHELLSSYAKPTVSPATLAHLHRLSALTPPDEGSQDHRTLTLELEELIKLVEAVRTANLGGSDTPTDETGIPDGRIWPENMGIDIQSRQELQEESSDGRRLLAHATRTERGLYLVENDRSYMK